MRLAVIYALTSSMALSVLLHCGTEIKDDLRSRTGASGGASVTKDLVNGTSEQGREMAGLLSELSLLAGGQPSKQEFVEIVYRFSLDRRPFGVSPPEDKDLPSGICLLASGKTLTAADALAFVSDESDHVIISAKSDVPISQCLGVLSPHILAIGLSYQEAFLTFLPVKP